MTGATMRSFESAETSASLQRLRATAASKHYEWWGDVENQINTMLALAQSAWKRKIPGLHNETLVFLIRQVRKTTAEIYGQLVTELLRRIQHIAAPAAMNFREVATQDILETVEEQVMKLVLTETPSRQSEFLEMAFSLAVVRRTHQVVKMHKRSVFGNTGLYDFGLGDYEADDEIQALKLVPDDGPSPEASFADKELVERLLGIAHAFVKKPKHLKALLLWCDGMAITARDGEECIATYFQVTGAQARWYIKTAIQQIRDALGGTI